MIKKEKQLLEGSRAIALTISNLEPQVIAAYPITPQTHIVEDLAKFKADNQAKYEYVLAESEFAAASIVLGASATGARVYSATSSQGLLLMAEVLFNISGLRMPVVMTIANRAVGAPINIWNDHSDIMAMRDCGAIILFASNHQEAVNLHIIAYKIAEKLRLPVLVNVDGFILTHSYDSVTIPNKQIIKKFLPKYKPQKNSYLDPKNPITIGAFFTPQDFWLERKKLHNDILLAKQEIKKAHQQWSKLFKTNSNSNGLVEYYGKKKAKKIIIALGSISGTIKEVLKKHKNSALINIQSYRPFPSEDIKQLCQKAKEIIVVDRAISPGALGGPLFLDIKSTLKQDGIYNYLLGLGGKDVSEEIIDHILKTKKHQSLTFL
jgi:pyruvate ferredoxin oxidoreductase alpha subunit